MAEIVTQAQVKELAKTEALHPTMSDMRSLPGFREKEDGSWTAPAKGAWGEAMKPYWRVSQERHQRTLGNGAFEPRKKPRGAVTMMVGPDGVLWKLKDGEWVRA